MTVAELISELEKHHPLAIVVTPWQERGGQDGWVDGISVEPDTLVVDPRNSIRYLTRYRDPSEQVGAEVVRVVKIS